MSRRSDQLRTVAQNAWENHLEWADKNNPAELPDEKYWCAIDAVCESFEEGDIPDDCRDLSEAVDNLREQYRLYNDREEVGNDQDDIEERKRKDMPKESFFLALECIGSSVSQKTLRYRAALEPMAKLRAEGCSDNQIAVIYNLRDRNRNFMPHLVSQEIDKPGSVLKTPGAVDGRNWIDRRQEKDGDGNLSAERFAAIAEKQREKRRTRKECKETLRDLWAIGNQTGMEPISVKQAALMKHMPESEVAAEFERFDREYQEQIASGEIVDAKTQTIREMASRDIKPTAIAADLKIDVKEVAAALKGWKKPKKESVGAS